MAFLCLHQKDIKKCLFQFICITIFGGVTITTLQGHVNYTPSNNGSYEICYPDSNLKSNRETGIKTIDEYIPPVLAQDTSDATKGIIIDSNSIDIELLKLIEGQADTTIVIKDSVEVSDTTYTELVDSSARVEQFVHKRSDLPVVEPFPRPRYSLYLDDQSSPALKRSVELDSTGNFVTVYVKVNDHDVKVPFTMTLDQYIRRRFVEETQNNWRGFVNDYKIVDKGDDLAGLLGTITNIEIPVPANPLMSIFGRNVINLRTTGMIDIRFGFRNQMSDQITLSPHDRSRNEPDFNQDVQINVDGTVGDKLKINADWNTERTFEYENQLRIHYTGFEDEIVQKVEAGNVSLQTPSLAGGGQTLFGIKSKFQFGPLNLTTLLSQKKGQTREITISGGAQSRPIEIFPYDYSTSHYFLDLVYINYFDSVYKTIIPQLTTTMHQYRPIKEQLELWISIPGNQINAGKVKANAYIDLPPRRENEEYPEHFYDLNNPQPGISESGYFIKLDQSQYRVNDNAGFISLNTRVPDDQVLAVAYRIMGPINPSTGDDRIYYGEYARGDTLRPLILKLLKPRNLQPSYRTAWNLQLKNIYSLGVKNVKREGFELDVVYRPPGEAESKILRGKNLLEALELDRYNTSNQPGPDTYFDFLPGVTIDDERGEIIFPTLRPFDKALLRNIPDIDSSLLFWEIYDTARSVAMRSISKNVYVIKVVSSAGRQSRIPLGAFNIAEGSVQVLMNGSPLTPGVDYDVNYIVGEVIIRNEQALNPGVNLQIKYEQPDLLQMASKSLIGARGEMNPFPNSTLGFTLMNLNQQTLSDKVRLGEEPTSNTVLGVDGSAQMDLPFLTDAIDALPFYRTKEMSTLRISGEGAYILPDANTKKSPIGGDRQASIAYIDDFEGARRAIPLSVNYSSWKPISAPLFSNDSALSINNRAKLMWYNNTRDYEAVGVKEIWPEKYFRRGEDFVSVLILDYNPNVRSMYNYSPNFLPSPNNYNGVMRYISSTAGNLIDQNIEYLELWFKADTTNIANVSHGRICIDLGIISEDVIPNGQLNTEDLNGNSSLNPGEDVGLDGLSDQQERERYPAHLFPWLDPNDPSGDNWHYSVGSKDFSRVNGSEGNMMSAEGRFPETEDLNGNGIVNLENNYAQYEIPIVKNDTHGDIFIGGGKHGWYQVRIPLLNPTNIFSSHGTTSINTILQNVQFIRLWLKGFSDTLKIRIAEINLVANQWLVLAKDDTVMRTSVVNIEDNPNYSIPPGVIRERDRTQPDQEIYGNEQSLALILNGLERGQERQAVKFFPGRPIDLFNYRMMKMFVHGDKYDFKYSDSVIYNPQIFIRFGADTLNFYQFMQPIYPGWDERNNVEIDFSQLTAVKADPTRDSVNKIHQVPVPGRIDGATYAVRGNPSLTQIRYIGIGVYYPLRGNSTELLWGEVWVNELRVIEVDNSPGSAYRFDTQIKLTNLGNISVNLSKVDPNFHTIDQRFGDRVFKTNWAVNTRFNFDEFLPSSWEGTTIPFGYTHQEFVAKPRYLPNSDVMVEKAAERADAQGITGESIRRESQSIRVQESYSIDPVRINLPFKAWYIKETFNKISYRFVYSKAAERNPSTVARWNWSWSFKMNYGTDIPPNLYFQPFKALFEGVFLFSEFKDWKFYYFPITNLSGEVGGQRSRSYDLSRAPGSVSREARSFQGGKSFGFRWKITENGLLSPSGDYGASFGRDLIDWDNDTVGRDFYSIVRTMLFRGRDGRFDQRFNFNPRLKLPNILNITNFMDINASYSVNYNWQNTFQQGDLGKSAGFGNNITLSSNFRLKALTDPWFKSTPPSSNVTSQPRLTPRGNQSDETMSEPAQQDSGKSTSDKQKLKLGEQLKYLARIFIKIPLLDYENINIVFNQTNRVGNSGVRGGTGFANFWGRYPFQGSLVEYGPSRLYQLGLVTDPSGTIKYSPQSSFPFVGWETKPGLRAPNALLNDQFNQGNNISLKTNRPLWEGANIELNWRIGWQYNKNATVVTDSLGVPSVGNVSISGNVDRSYLTIPPFLFLKMFKSDLMNVGKKYQKLRTEKPADVAITESFEEGLEAFPFMRPFFGQFVPRVNWSIRWDGVEKVVGLSSVFQRLSIDHNYTSLFRRNFRGVPGVGERTDMAQVNYGFAPLIGASMTFKELYKGNITGAFRFNSSTSFDLNIAAQNIVETITQEISLSLSYGRRGFNIPLFGLSLSNDIDITMTFSRARNSRNMYDVNKLGDDEEGTPLEGNTRTQLEPRLRYVLSSRVSASLFYRYSRMAPDEEGSTIYGNTVNEAGIDLRIAIQ